MTFCGTKELKLIIADFIACYSLLLQHSDYLVNWFKCLKHRLHMLKSGKINQTNLLNIFRVKDAKKCHQQVSHCSELLQECIIVVVCTKNLYKIIMIIIMLSLTHTSSSSSTILKLHLATRPLYSV